MTLLQLDNLTVGYGQLPPTVTGVSLALASGRVVGLVGESGSGKSTIARAIVGLADVRHGAVLLDGEDIAHARGKRLRVVRRRVQLIFQDPYQSLNPRRTVGQHLADVVLAHRTTSGRPLSQAVESLLEDVRLSADLADRYPHQLSGGQRQRVAIARALAADPDIIVADEITSALDVSVQAGILRLLDRLRRERSLGCLFISHDLAVVRSVSDSVAVMYCGQLVEHAPAAEVFTSPRHPYTRALVDAVPRRGHSISPLDGDPATPLNFPNGCRFHPRCPRGPRAVADHGQCETRDPALSPQPDADGAFVACHFPIVSR